MSDQLIEQQLNSQIIKKIDDYIIKSGEEITQEVKKEFVNTLLKGRSVDLSGVTAIRGFIYQYFIGAKYLVDMLFAKDAWWDKVIFELLDDIALYGEKNIRFIQVKTKKDSDTVNNLTLGELYERSKKKGSWLDKLFLLNLHIFDLRHNVAKRDDAFFDKFDLQFELATNSQYNKDIVSYEKSENFQSDIEVCKYQTLKEKIDTDNLEWKVKYLGKDFTFTKHNYDDSNKNINWYLKRFRVKRHGHILALRQEIIDKIMSNTAGNMDSFHAYKASLILDMVLVEIIKKTCQDSDSVSLDTFVFDRETFRSQFDAWSEIAELSAAESATRDSLHEKFTNYFEIIKDEFQGGVWQPNLKQELLLTLTKLQNQLSDSIQSQRDAYAYHRFLHRIFSLNNFSTRFPIKEIDTVRVIHALKTYIYCLVFYNKAEYSPHDSKLSFKKGLDLNQEAKIFSIYNVRKTIDTEWAKKMVRSAAKDCITSESYNYDFYCFLADVKDIKKKERSRNKMDSIHATVTEIVHDESEQLDMQDILNGKEITRLLEKIKFTPIKVVEEYFDYLEENQPTNSFQEEEIINEWNKELTDEEI